MAAEKRLVYANTVYEMGHRTPFHIGIADLCDLKELLEDVPTADAVEVVHGRWIVRVEFNNGERVIAACSNCNVQGEVRTHRNEWGIWHIHSPYCPNCGAKMDGGTV